jgi:hypothetical protein
LGAWVATIVFTSSDQQSSPVQYWSESIVSLASRTWRHIVGSRFTHGAGASFVSAWAIPAASNTNAETERAIATTDATMAPKIQSRNLTLRV